VPIFPIEYDSEYPEIFPRRDDAGVCPNELKQIKTKESKRVCFILKYFNEIKDIGTENEMKLVLTISLS
jgi:hypothetical protein